MMQLPDRLLLEYKGFAGSEPGAVARSLHDWKGDLGECWVAAGADFLALFSKSLGEADHTAYGFPADSIGSAELTKDGPFVVLSFASGGVDYAMKFASWDRAQLGKIMKVLGIELEKPATVADLTPPIAFCALIQAMIDCDGIVHPLESIHLSRNLDEEAILAGQAALKQRGTNGVLKESARLLTEDQKLCILSNMASVAMIDGMLEVEEQRLLRETREAFEIAEASFDSLFETLLIKNNLTVFEDAQSLAILGAVRLVMMKVDEEDKAPEKEQLSFLISDPAVLDQATRLFETLGTAGLIDLCAKTLNSAQKKCLAINLLEMAMVDGLLRRTEQELMDRFRPALGLADDSAYESILSSLLQKNQLSALYAEGSS